MAQEIILQERMAAAEQTAMAVILRPELQKLRRLSLGTVHWPDQPVRKYLSGGLTLTAIERKQAEKLLADLRTAATGDVSRDCMAQRMALLAKMLLAYPNSQNSEDAGRARAEAYADALSDVAPWAIQRAIRKWHRGECGSEHNYSFAPAPAVLLAVCRLILWQHLRCMEHIQGLLDALPFDRAMDSTPIGENVTALRVAAE